jgi:hypothetical protein
LYKKDIEVSPNIIIDLVQSSVTEEMNNDMLREYNNDEIGDALFQIGPMKAPGPYGFPARFFQRN